MDAPTIIDISLPLEIGMMSYPGNPEFQKSLSSDLECGASSTVSNLALGSHSGTHVDAPSHCILKSDSIDKVALENFYGLCRVFDATKEVPSVSLEFVKSKQISKGDRILFKTKNSITGFDSWRDDYIFLSPQASEYLAQIGVRLVGIDFLSIKEKGSQDNRPHTALLSVGASILEGIDLSKVSEDKYILCAFPLRIIGCDGAPTRAVLIKQS